MATPEQENEARERLRKNLDALAEISPEKLARREELGSALSFQSGIPSFERTLKLFAELGRIDLDGAAFPTLNELATAAEEALGEFTLIKDFNVETAGAPPAQARDNLINTVRDRYDHYYPMITPHIAYAT